MGDQMPKWRTYEEVARYLLDKFSTHFGLDGVEGKQRVPGKTGTEWEIDCKGVRKDGDIFVVVECRRHTTSRLSQEDVGGLAYRIHHTGASGGILVTPLDLQSGARKVAAYENIRHVILDQDSTNEEYVMQWLNHIVTGDVELYDGPRKVEYSDIIITERDRKESC